MGELFIILLMLLNGRTLTKQSNDDITVTALQKPLLPINLTPCNIIYIKHTFFYYIELPPIKEQIFIVMSHFSTLKKLITDKIC